MIHAQLEDATKLYIFWLFLFCLVTASAIFNHFFHQSSLLIVTSVLFFYVWIFLISKLDKICVLCDQSQSKFIYLRLLIPVIGTIISFYKVSEIVKRS